MRASNIIEFVFRQQHYGPTIQATQFGERIYKANEDDIEKFKQTNTFVTNWLAASDVRHLERVATTYYVTKKHPRDPVTERAKRMSALEPHVDIVAAEEAVKIATKKGRRRGEEMACLTRSAILGCGSATPAFVQVAWEQRFPLRTLQRASTIIQNLHLPMEERNASTVSNVAPDSSRQSPRRILPSVFRLDARTRGVQLFGRPPRKRGCRKFLPQGRPCYLVLPQQICRSPGQRTQRSEPEIPP